MNQIAPSLTAATRPAATRDHDAQALRDEVDRHRAEARQLDTLAQPLRDDVSRLDRELADVAGRLRPLVNGQLGLIKRYKAEAILAATGGALAIGSVFVVGSMPLVGFPIMALGVGAMLGSLWGRKKSYERRDAMLAEAAPLNESKARFEKERKQVCGELAGIDTRQQAAERAQLAAQKKLDVLRMAGAQAPASSVEMSDSHVTIGGVSVARRSSP